MTRLSNEDLKKEIKKKEIKKIFGQKIKKPIVDTGLGFSVDGGRDNLQDFQGGLSIGYYKVKGADNIIRDVTKEDMELIIQKIQLRGLMLYQRKWELEELIKTDINTDITTGWP